MRLRDVVIVGAGPAGLGAARTLARLGFSTVVLERRHESELTANRCAMTISPIAGLISGMWRSEGSLYFPVLDVEVPEVAIIGWPIDRRLIGPNGKGVRAIAPSRRDFPVALVDRSQMLVRLAAQARAAGAELLYATEATGFIVDEGQILGVRTRRGKLRSHAVIDAAGSGSGFGAPAESLLIPRTPTQDVFVLSQEYWGAAATSEDVGEVTTFGQRYTSAKSAIGSVVIPEAGRATAHFTVFPEPQDGHSAEHFWPLVEQFVECDERVSRYFAGAQPMLRSARHWTLGNSAGQAGGNGLIVVGDAAVAGGMLGVLPALYLGRQAALILAEAIDAGDVGHERLVPFEQVLASPALQALAAEGRVMQVLASFEDVQIDRFFEILRQDRSEQALYSNWGTIAGDVAGALEDEFPVLAQAKQSGPSRYGTESGTLPAKDAPGWRPDLGPLGALLPL
jgi:flavin-dependent dehydrogenase